MFHIVKAMVFPVVMYGYESWTISNAEHQRNWCFWAVVLGKTLESHLDCVEVKPVHPKWNQSRIFIGCWSWNSNTLATWCKELTHWKRPWCWERLKAGGKGEPEKLDYISSVQFSRSVMSDSLRPHEPQGARLPCPSPAPRVYTNSCPLSWWCHPTISSSVIPFSFCLQSFPASGSFQIRQFFASGGQSIGVSASASVLSMNIQDWSPLGWTGWISLQSKELSRVFSNTTVQKHQFFCA